MVAQSPSRRLRVLVVEQRPHVIDTLRNMLDLDRLECEVALNLQTAREILSERRMDAVVVDAKVDPPPQGGIPALIRELKQANSGMKVVIFNGTTRDATQRRMRRLGADGYLSTRSGPDALERSVRRLLGQAG